MSSEDSKHSSDPPEELSRSTPLLHRIGSVRSAQRVSGAGAYQTAGAAPSSIYRHLETHNAARHGVGVKSPSIRDEKPHTTALLHVPGVRHASRALPPDRTDGQKEGENT
jgi:hypothetical protein